MVISPFQINFKSFVQAPLSRDRSNFIDKRLLKFVEFDFTL